VFIGSDAITFCSPMGVNGSFDTEAAGVVEQWDDEDVAEQDRIMKILA
jgi:hypothetical protein